MASLATYITPHVKIMQKNPIRKALSIIIIF